MKIEANAPPFFSEVWIGEKLLGNSFYSYLEKFSGPIAIITDSRVAKLFGSKLLKDLKKKREAALFSFPAGEKSKNRKTKEKIEDSFVQKGFGKDTLVIGLGGGVVTDLAGFIAATFCRGLKLILIPTTLVGMVDAAIGGKNGVNTPKAKNLIGSVYFPELIIADNHLLKTLNEKEMAMGGAEILKYGLIEDPSLFQDLGKLFDSLEQTIEKSILVKKRVVEEDPEEKKGLRRILNFGHTIGHALEAIENYKLSHGEAVAMGLLVESYISHLMGYLSSPDFHKIERLLANSPFPMKISSRVTKGKMLSAMARDKKAKGSKPRFVLIEKIGKVVPFAGEYCKIVPNEILDQALDWMLKELK